MPQITFLPIPKPRWMITMYAVVLIGILSPIMATAGNFYRYKANGQTYVTNSITDAHRKNGYDVLDDNYRLIKTVDAALSVEQRKALMNEAAAADQQQQADERLIQAYGSVERAQQKQRSLLTDLKRRKLQIIEEINTQQQQLDIALDQPEEDKQKDANVEIIQQNITNLNFQLEKVIIDQQKVLGEYNRAMRRLRHLGKHN